MDGSVILDATLVFVGREDSCRQHCFEVAENVLLAGKLLRLSYSKKFLVEKDLNSWLVFSGTFMPFFCKINVGI